MNKHGIRARVLLLAMLPLALVAFALTWYSVLARQGDIERALEDRSIAVARQLAQSCEYGLFVGELESLTRQARLSLISAGASAVVIVQSDGQELLRLGLPRLKPEWSPDQTAILVRDAETLLVSAPVMQAPIEVDYAPRHGMDGRLLGYVALEIPRRATLDRQREVLFTSLTVTLLGLALAALLAWRLGRAIVRPISRLAEAVERIGGGELDVRVDVEAGGEFVVLEQGINRMAAELQVSDAQLREKIRKATEELAWRADHDSLTGLLNRVAFDAAINDVAEQAAAGRPFCLLYLDLDRFKQVNDIGGHVAGDEVLRQFVGVTRTLLNAEDRFARLGGDEFGILLAGCDTASAEERAWAIRHAVAAHRFHCGGRAYEIGVSIGVAGMNPGWSSPDMLTSAADHACYAAKHGGRDQVCVHSAAMAGVKA